MDYEKIAKEISRCRLVIDGVSEFDAPRVIQILEHEFEPDRQMLHDFHATDATIAIQEREEIKQQRDALQVKLAEAEEEIKADDQIIANHRKVIHLIPECSMHGYCLAHAREWVETIVAKTLERAAEIALDQVTGVNKWDYTAGHDAARHQCHDAILKEANE